MTPSEFARRAAALASDGGVKVEILDEHRIEELGMGLLLGVARGSSEPPRLMVFRHDPPGAPAGPVLGLVGKGITFDTGGISIKPADGMERMKDDMAGGAAVACAMRAISLLQAPIRVVGVVPATENMPGGRAIKPGDILKSAAGKTVEVINTDAEGRLILGDGLWYAQQLGATHLVDVATLTGAVVVALGKSTSGLFGTPPEWVEHVRRVGDARRGSRLADADLRRLPRAVEKRDRRLHQHRRPAGRIDHRGAVPEGIQRRAAVGRTSTSPAPPGPRTRGRTCRRDRAASPSARSRSSPSPAANGTSALESSPASLLQDKPDGAIIVKLDSAEERTVDAQRCPARLARA